MSEPAVSVLPVDLVNAVEWFIDDQHDRARKYDNAEVLDESGAFVLHRLAAQIYARGWDDGERAADEKQRGQRRRERDAEQHAADETPDDEEQR